MGSGPTRDIRLLAEPRPPAATGRSPDSTRGYFALTRQTVSVHDVATESDRLRERLDRATAHLDPPFAVVDLAAFDANAAALADRAAGKPVRVASKSVRCRELLSRALGRPGWQGVMAFTLPEAIWLVRAGVTDDVLVGVPDRRPGGPRRAGRRPGARRGGHPDGRRHRTSST